MPWEYMGRGNFSVIITATFDVYLNYFICRAGDCDFENGLCTWVNSPNILEDEFDWTRGSGSTPSNFTGPPTDHTTGTKKGWHFFNLVFCFSFRYISL